MKDVITCRLIHMFDYCNEILVKKLIEAGIDGDYVELRSSYEYKTFIEENNTPSISLYNAQKWLRESKDIIITPVMSYSKPDEDGYSLVEGYRFQILTHCNNKRYKFLNNEHIYVSKSTFINYEDALMFGITHCLEYYVK